MGIGKLGFGLMRLPQKSDNPTDIDIELLNKNGGLIFGRGFYIF